MSQLFPITNICDECMTYVERNVNTLIRILFEVKWTLRYKEYNLKPRQIKKTISIDYKRNSFHRFILSWWITTRIGLL